MPLSPFVLAAIGFGAVGVILVLAGVVALFRWRPMRFVFRTLVGLLLLALGALAGGIAIGIQGYQALTREAVAARIMVRPSREPQKFTAYVRFPDGRSQMFELAGDEIYVDAHILKWKPIANFVGLHTAYELDRVAGRYESVADERTRPRTVYALARPTVVDVFAAARRLKLAPVVDAEYGSATFVGAGRSARFEVRVSTTGLLVRPVP